MLWLSICCLLGCGSCQPQPVKTIEVPASVQCDPTLGQTCWLVTEMFIQEHKALFMEVVRLKAELDECQQRR